MNGLHLTDIQSVSVTYPSGNVPGNSIRVSVDYRYHYITPVKAIVNFLSAGALPDYVPVNSTTDMRVE